MKLTARNLVWAAGGTPIVRDVSFEVAAGEFLGLVGPNGSGKSSLMALLAGLRTPQAGAVLLDGTPLPALGRRAVARCLAFVEQQAGTAERLTARQAVELGRTPHLGALSPWTGADDAIVEAALRAVDMAGRGARLWHTLSGGERQRLHVARALAQQPRVLLLDEPTNHLDIAHQLGLLDLVHRQGLTVVAALHDLNHAAMFCDRLAVLQEGRLVALGRPADILTPARLAAVFQVTAAVEATPDGLCIVRFARPDRPATGEAARAPGLARMR